MNPSANTQILEPHSKLREALLFCLLFVACLLTFSKGKAQVGLTMGWDLNFNHTDVMMEFGAGIGFADEIDASARLTYMGRLGRRRVQIESGRPNLLYQYREGMNLFGIELEKRFVLTEFNETNRMGILIAGWGGLAIGSYSGTSQRPAGHFQWIAKVAAYFQTEVVYFRLGYAYFPWETRSIFDHRLFLGIHFLFSDL